MNYGSAVAVSLSFSTVWAELMPQRLLFRFTVVFFALLLCGCGLYITSSTMGVHLAVFAVCWFRGWGGSIKCTFVALTPLISPSVFLLFLLCHLTFRSLFSSHAPFPQLVPKPC